MSGIPDRRAINLAQLHAEHTKASSHASLAIVRVSEATDRRRARELAHLLRDHREEPISGEEIAWRDGFDALLTLYSFIELGVWTGDLPGELPFTLARDAHQVLAHAAVRAYYEEHYPLALPGLLRRRLEGAPVVDAGSLHAPGRFGSFLEMSRVLDRDDDLEVFLWLLDDGSYGDVSLADVLALLRTPRSFLNAIGTRPTKRSVVASAAVGFSKLLRFCADFDALLRRTATQPLLRAGFWYAHAYWFGRLSLQMRDDLHRGIDALAWKSKSWVPLKVDLENRRQDEDREAVTSVPSRSAAVQAIIDREADAERTRLRRIVDRLTSGRLARPIRGRLEPKVRRALHPHSERDLARSGDARRTNVNLAE